MSAPIRRPPEIGQREFDRWSFELWRRLNDTSLLAFSWASLSKAGSALTDIETRKHSMLQNVEGFDPTDADSVKNKHVSNADTMRWEAAAAASVGGIGDGTFAGPSGVVVNFTDTGTTDYMIVVAPTSSGTGHNGDWWFAPIDSTSARIYNSGTAGGTFRFKVMK